MVALHRFRIPMGHKKDGCWLQVVALRRFKLRQNALVVLQGGCSLQVVALRRWFLKQLGLYFHSS